MSESNKYPDKCPITNLPLFMEIEHPSLGLVPTYGGPYDSYTIPEVDDDGDFVRYRYDHDEGCWVDGVETVGNAVEIIIDIRAKLEAAEKSLEKINDIRNSIVGMQKINWSEHIYPLVAALNEAGLKGMGYPKAMPYFGTLIERTKSAEQECNNLQAANGGLREALEAVLNNARRLSPKETKGINHTVTQYIIGHPFMSIAKDALAKYRGGATGETI